MFSSSNANDLNAMLPLASDDAEIVSIIKTAIQYFTINLGARNELRCAEFRLVALKALNALQDTTILKSWLPQVKGLVYTESVLMD